jgi:hypothetical protein
MTAYYPLGELFSVLDTKLLRLTLVKREKERELANGDETIILTGIRYPRKGFVDTHFSLVGGLNSLFFSTSL